MMHDPLLPPPPPPSAKTTAKSAMSTKKKIKKPATSAKILVTGLSATAMLGMASGYALAGKAPTPEIANTNISSDNTVATPGQQQPQGTPAAPTSTVAPVITVPSTNSVAPVITNPPVVEVPVPQATPATPGNSNNGWQQQQSSGSR